MRTWRRFRALDAADRRLLVEAAAWLSLVCIAIEVLPFLTLQRVLAALCERLAARSGDRTAPPDRVMWAVASAARHFPLRSTCLIQSMAGQAMLSRRHLDCTLRLGVRRDTGRSALAAHAWIEHGGRVVLGQVEDLSEYVPLQ